MDIFTSDQDVRFSVISHLAICQKHASSFAVVQFNQKPVRGGSAISLISFLYEPISVLYIIYMLSHGTMQLLARFPAATVMRSLVKSKTARN